MNIIVDTREQKPLWEEKEGFVERRKLDEGDYTTAKLLNKFHIERKSANDLYGSIIQGHERFRKELLRAQEKGIILRIFVECSKRDFVGKKFPGGWRLKMKPAILAKIVSTISEKYSVDFVWCDGRDDMIQKIHEDFSYFEGCLEVDNAKKGL